MEKRVQSCWPCSPERWRRAGDPRRSGPLGAELALRGWNSVEDLDQAKHLSSVVHRRGLLMPGMTIAETEPADLIVLDTAPEADNPGSIGCCAARIALLVPFEGAEEASVQAISLVLQWLESALNCRLLGFVPTMATLRWSESRQWMEELIRGSASDNALDTLLPP